MMFAFGKAMALINSARFPSGGGRDVPACRVPDVPAALGAAGLRTVGNTICARAASLSSACPAGNLPAWRIYAARSVDWLLERLPGRLNGIVFWILSTRFASGWALRFERKPS